MAFAVPADSASSLPCKFDNPVVDAVIGDLLKEGNRWGVRWTFGGSDAPIWKGEPELGTGKDLAKLLGVLTFWSTLVNIVLVKALTDIEISVAPSPLQRTKTTVKGQEGIAQAHVHMTAGPSGKYQRCVELVAAAAGITVTAQAPRDLAGTAVTWSLDGGNASPLILSNDKNEWTSVADDHGVDRTSIYGRSQATDLDAAALPVLKNAGVTAAVNPDTADSMWKTTWKAVVDAWNFGNAVGIGPTRSVNPISIGNSILKAALRALNHFGWLSARADIPVRDWGYPTLRWTIKMGQYLLTHYDNPDMTTADSRGIFTLTGKAPLQPLAEGGLAFAYAADTSLLRNASTINGACGHVQTLGLCNISEKLVATHAGQLRISQVHLDAHQFPVAVTASIAHMPSLTLTTTCTGTCGPDASGTGTGGGLAQEILNRFFPDSPDVTIKGFTRDPRSGNFVSTMDVKQDLGDAFNVGNSSIHAVWTIEGLTSP